MGLFKFILKFDREMTKTYRLENMCSNLTLSRWSHKTSYVEILRRDSFYCTGIFQIFQQVSVAEKAALTLALPRGYKKTMLNSTEHEISTAHKN